MTLRSRSSMAAIATALTLATASGVVMPVAVPVAVADTNDAMPHHVAVFPTKKGKAYHHVFKTYGDISLMRHTYHTAARLYNQTPGAIPDEDKAEKARAFEIQEQSEFACYIAKARYILSILQYEGNKDAQGIDISKVGIDKDESAKALPIVEAASKDASASDLAIPKDDPRAAGLHARAKLFREGRDKLSDYTTLLAEGKKPNEESAFAVVDWGVKAEWLEKAKKEVKPGEDALKLKVVKVGELKEGEDGALHGQLSDADRDNMRSVGEENKTALAARYPQSAEDNDASNGGTHGVTPLPDGSDPDPNPANPPADDSQDWIIITAVMSVVGILAPVLAALAVALRDGRNGILGRFLR